MTKKAAKPPKDMVRPALMPDGTWVSSEGMLSYSRLATYIQCPYKHDLSYNRGIKTRVTPHYFRLGDLVHTGIEHLLAGGDPYVSIAAKAKGWLEDWDEDIVDAMADDIQVQVNKATGILAKLIRDKVFDEWETATILGLPASELRMAIPFPGWPGMVLICDWLAQHKETGALYLWDFKTTGQILPDDVELLNLQKVTYQYGLRQFGIDVTGTVRLQIRNENPKTPELNKKETALLKRDIMSDWHTYLNAILEHGFDPDEYQDMKKKLDQKVFHKTTRALRTREEVDRVWASVILPVANAVKNFNAAYRCMNYKNCQACWAKELCVEEMKGEDSEHLLKTLYRHRDEKPNTQVRVEKK